MREASRSLTFPADRQPISLVILHTLRMRRASFTLLLALCTLLIPSARGAGQQGASTSFDRALATRPDVRRALGWLDSNFTRQVAEWVRIAEMQGQSRHERTRAAYVRRVMREEGLTVTTDSIGNVIGRRAGTGGGPTIVFAAHLDIVHPLGTNLEVRRQGDTLRAPGIFDNSASVANMLAVIRALNRARIRTAGDLVFIGTAQEELGLMGMKYWLEHAPRAPDMLVAMDGGLGPVNYGALGIYWTRYFFRGEGAHTVNSTGRPHPARALAAAIGSIYELRVPEGRGGAVFNVGMLDGGAIFNGIPQEVSFTMDLRSVNPTLLDSLDREIESRVARAAEREKVTWAKEEVQRNKAGGTEEMLADRRAHPLVQTAIDVHRFLGIDIGERGAAATGSTDANAGVVRGIPSISVGRSRGGNQHTLSEWAEVTSALPATKMILLLALSLAGGRTPAS